MDEPNTSGILGVVFDMDGVLVDTSPCHGEAYRRLWVKLGLPEISYEQLAGRSTKGVIEEYCPDLSKEARNQSVSFKQNEALTLLREADIVFADTVESVRELHENNFKLALATSASSGSTRLVLERLGIHDLFEVVVTGDQVTRAKPDPEIFKKAIRSLGLVVSQSLIIEDSAAGIAAGLASGGRVINVRNRVENVKNNEHERFLGYYSDLKKVTHLLTGRAP